MDAFIQSKLGDIDNDVLGKVLGKTFDFDLVGDLFKDTTELRAVRIDMENDRNVCAQNLAFCDLEEVDMQNLAQHDILLEVLHQNRMVLATDLDGQQCRFGEMAQL